MSVRSCSKPVIKKEILKAAASGKKRHATYTGTKIKMTADFLSKTKRKKQKSDIFKVMKEKELKT